MTRPGARWWSDATSAPAGIQQAEEHARAMLDMVSQDDALRAALTTDELSAMDLSTFGQLRNLAGLAPAVPPVPEGQDPGAQAPGDQVSADAAIAAQYADTPLDLGALSMSEYAQVRDRYIKPTAGRGLFD